MAVGAEDFSVELEVPLPFESVAPELAAAVPPDVEAAEPLCELVDSAFPLAGLGFVAVDPTELVSAGDADAELDPVRFLSASSRSRTKQAVSLTFVLPPHHQSLYITYRRRPWPRHRECTEK